MAETPLSGPRDSVAQMLARIVLSALPTPNGLTFTEENGCLTLIFRTVGDGLEWAQAFDRRVEGDAVVAGRDDRVLMVSSWGWHGWRVIPVAVDRASRGEELGCETAERLRAVVDGPGGGRS
jgi:hypothetical protein